jgi:hypothetical protein
MVEGIARSRIVAVPVDVSWKIVEHVPKPHLRAPGDVRRNSMSGSTSRKEVAGSGESGERVLDRTCLVGQLHTFWKLPLGPQCLNDVVKDRFENFGI